jgi:hypothetical protein
MSIRTDYSTGFDQAKARPDHSLPFLEVSYLVLTWDGLPLVLAFSYYVIEAPNSHPCDDRLALECFHSRLQNWKTFMEQDRVFFRERNC